MSLKVWISGTTDLKDQGVSITNWINHGTSIATNGKLGKCLNFNGSSNYLIDDSNAFNKSTWTICAWVYTKSTSGNQCILCTRKGIGYGISVFFIGSVLRIDCGTNNANCQWSTSYTVKTNEWFHLCIQSNGSSVSYYINGNLMETHVITSDVTSYSQYTSIGASHANNSSLGNYLNGMLNDVRIYDNALTPREIKNISQGLLLHYSLSNRGFGGENLLKNTDFNGVSKKYVLQSGSEGGFQFAPVTYKRNTQYVLSCRLRGNANMNLYLISSSGNQAYNWVNRNELSDTEYRFFNIPFLSRSDRDVSNLYICTRYGTSNSSVGDWFEIEPYSLKFEEGSKPTPWVPHSSDLLYSKLELDNNIEYDLSGYQYNGELYTTDGTGEFIYTSDSPRHKVACNIHSINSTANSKAGTAYIRGDCELTTPQQLTVAFWCYARAEGYGSSIVQGMFCTTNYDGDSIGTDYQTSGMNHRDGNINVNPSSGSQILLPITFIANQWHHYAFTYDGQYARAYRDGVLFSTKNFSSAITLGTFKHVVIGFSKAGGVWRRNNNSYSDFRVYATALSADEVKYLYDGGDVS